MVTLSVFFEKLDVNILVSTLLGRLDLVAMDGDIVVFVEEISVSTFAYRLIWESISCSSIHLPSFLFLLSHASFVKGDSFV